MNEEIEYFLESLSKMTKEEADFIEEILRWPIVKRMAFIIAKKSYDEEAEALEAAKEADKDIEANGTISWEELKKILHIDETTQQEKTPPEKTSP